MTFNLRILLALFWALSGCSCGSALPQSTIPPPSETNELSRSYPTDLAVASPYADAGADADLVRGTLAQRLIGENPGASFHEKVDEIGSVINATSTADCRFQINFSPKQERAACYGPPIQYQNHPEALPGDPGTGFLPPGDLGLWEETDSVTGDACAASEVNTLFANISGQTDTALGMFASVLCLANNKGVSLPAVGESADVATEMSSLLSDMGLDLVVSLATLTRTADDADGHAVYLQEIQGQTPSGHTLSMKLRHIPLDETNSLYKGKLSLNLSSPTAGISFNCGQQQGMTSAASIHYEKKSETLLTYRLLRGDYCGSGVDPFDENNDLDPSDKFNPNSPADNPQGWGNTFSRVHLNVNPSDGTGTFSYAWQAGPLDQNTRVFNATLTESDGSLGGCAYYGFGPDIADADAGTIDRFICNWTAPGSRPFGSKVSVERVQRQCFTQNSAGLFVSDESRLNIDYAPTTICNSTAAGFVFGDHSGVFSHDLLPLEEMDFVQPEPPEDL